MIEPVVYPDFALTTAFRWFGQGADTLYSYPIYFDVDAVQGVDVIIPYDKWLDGRVITGVGLMTSEAADSPLNLYPKNGIDYVPLTRAQAAFFELNLMDYVPGKVAEELIWEDFPLGRLADQTHVAGNELRANFLKTRFRFSTDNSFLRKTSGVAITAPYVIPLVFSFEK